MWFWLILRKTSTNVDLTGRIYAQPTASFVEEVARKFQWREVTSRGAAKGSLLFS